MQETSSTMDNGNGIHFSNLLSEFVYVRTYARWLAAQKRRETWPETVKRYVDYYVRNNPKLQNLTFDLAGQVEQAILNKDLLPSMRSLWCAGPAMDRDNTCGYNCLGAETPFITQSGVKRFSDFNNGDVVTVLTHSGAWKPAVVRNYGVQKLYNVQIVRGTSVQHVRATKNHQWLLADGSRTSDLRVSDRLERAPILVGSWVYEKSSPLERYYWALGYVYGDGTCVKGPQGEYTHSMVRLCGQDKSRFLDRFQELGFTTSSPPTFNGDAVAYTGHYLKALPSIEVDGYENVVAFVRGYLDADGAKNTNPGSPSPFRSLQSSNEASIEFVRSVFPAVGAYISREEDLTGQQTNFGVRPKTIRFALTLGFGASPHCAYSVKSITEDKEEEVWCLEVEDDHSFVLPNGIVTGNCSFLPIDNLKAFAEALYILMCGTGVGFSVERTFVDCLPKVAAPTGESASYVIEDSTEGWADSLHYALVEGHRGRKVWFDYSKIRPKGARLRIKGGTASGPEPLERVHNFVANILEKAAGRRLKPIEAHDIMCMIAEIVMVGGFRRASLISFSDPDDIEMRHAKDWRQGDVPPIRYMANNSAVWFERPDGERFREEWQNLIDSGSGERGFSIMNWNKRAARNTENIRSNPCHEVGLRFKRALNPWTGEGGGAQFCNLTAAVVRPGDTQQTLAHKVRLATWLGCIQASYTHFPYLRPAWKQLCDEDRLLGVDLTGQCDNPELTNNEGVLTSLNTVARMTAAHVSMLLDINEPVAITCGKPSGNSSQLVDCSSGFHPRYAPYYFRHVRVSSKDPLFKMIRDYGVPVFKENGQEHLPDDEVDVWVARFPVKAPEHAMLRDHETALEQCERYLRIMRTWCGIKGHNQSATIYVRPNEWLGVGQWLYQHFDEVTGLSFLPHSDADTKYRLLPYQEITKEQYEEALAALPELDFSNLRLYETDDEGEGASEPACVGGVCEL